MKYLRNTEGSIEYPFSLSILKGENPDTSFPREIPESLLAEYGIYPVTPTERPAPTLTQNPAEQTPQLINGVWTQVWAMVDAPAQEQERRSIKADTFVQNFISMTPAQVTAYVEANTNNIAEVRALLNKMALMLLALARREYR